MNPAPDSNAKHDRLLVLAPPDAMIPQVLTSIEWNPQRYERLIDGVQRLRGEVYLEDGAIDASLLSADGRYSQPADERAWHLIAMDEYGEVCGCSRYVAHSSSVSFSDLGVSHSALAQSEEWGPCLRAAVEFELEKASRRGISYAEVGGWALAPELRCTSEAVRIALGTFSLARLLGGCLGITMATRRHCSSSILRRIGGQPLKMGGIEMPSYFDPRYDCRMEILTFDSERPNPRFERWIEELKRYLSAIPVIRGGVLPQEEEAAMNAA